MCVCRLAGNLKLLVLLMLRFLADEGHQDDVGSTAARKGPQFCVCHIRI